MKNYFQGRCLEFITAPPFLHVTLLIIALTTIFAWIQFAVPWLVAFDGSFHIKYSYILGQEGFIDKLPWLQYTIHRDNYRDHHLLFHYLLIPFTFGDLNLGGKIATVFFAVLMGLSMYLVFTRSKVKYPIVWSLAMVLSSEPFLFRMSMLRVQAISLALLIFMCFLYMERRLILIYFASIIFVWLYDAFPLLLTLAFIFAISKRLIDEKWDLSPLIFTLLGVLTGMVLNPYFPENMTSLFYNIWRTIFFNVKGIELGGEWNPYDTWSLFKNSTPVFIVFFGTILSLPLIKKIKSEEFAALCLSIIFLILTLKARRFIEYWPAFAFLSAGLVIGRRANLKLQAGLMILVLPFFIFNMKNGIAETKATINPKIYEGSSKWLLKNSSPQDIVFNADWDDFPFLFFYNTKNYYIVGLDPMYLYSFDSEKSRLYKAITRGRVNNPSRFILKDYGARYVFLDRAHQKLLKKLMADSGAKKVFEDKGGYVFEVLPAPISKKKRGGGKKPESMGEKKE